MFKNKSNKIIYISLIIFISMGLYYLRYINLYKAIIIKDGKQYNRCIVDYEIIKDVEDDNYLGISISTETKWCLSNISKPSFGASIVYIHLKNDVIDDSFVNQRFFIDKEVRHVSIDMIKEGDIWKNTYIKVTDIHNEDSLSFFLKKIDLLNFKRGNMKEQYFLYKNNL